MELKDLIGEATAYDKKEKLEAGKPKSWLKSVSAFANGNGGTLIFGISDDDRIVGLADAESDSEVISEYVKTRLDPVPDIHLEFKEIDGKKLILLHVKAGTETPYYYIGDKQRIAYIRIGNESVVADRLQLKALVLKGSGRTYDALPSPYKFTDMAFTQLRSACYKRLHRSFDDSEFTSWGIIDENGALTYAGALLADSSPIRQSRIFCTRWNGLTMTSGLGEAFDDAELEGSVIGQLQDAVAFIRNNSRKRWWKESDHCEELPDYPERAVTEVICNAIIHRDYQELCSEIHIDIYDDRMEVYSPGGMKKILGEYARFESLEEYHAPEFTSNATEFHVTLWNLNYGTYVVKDVVNDFTKEPSQFTKEFTKEFTKAQRRIYKLISLNPKVNIDMIAEDLNLSTRQVKTYMKRLTDLHLIAREGGRKNGIWKILDKDYDDFFERI